MREVTAVVKIHSHEGVARFQHSQQNGCVGLGTRVRLNVGIFCSEEFFHTFNSKCFHLVNHLAASVIAFSRVSFSILVGEIGAHGFHYLVTNKVLTGNQFHSFQLALMLFLNQLEDFVVSFHVLLGLFVHFSRIVVAKLLQNFDLAKRMQIILNPWA